MGRAEDLSSVPVGGGESVFVPGLWGLGRAEDLVIIYPNGLISIYYSVNGIVKALRTLHLFQLVGPSYNIVIQPKNAQGAEDLRTCQWYRNFK